MQLASATRGPWSVGHVQPIGRPCSAWMYYATKDIKEKGVKFGRNFRNLEWDWPWPAIATGS